jgi:hypothetical protein
MARKNVLHGVAAAGLLSVIALALLMVLSSQAWIGSAARQGSLAAVLGTADVSDELHLYSGELDPTSGVRLTPFSRGTDITSNGGIAKQRFLRGDDGSSEDIQLKPDGEHFAWLKSFFPEQPGEIGRRPHVIQIFAANSDFVVDQTIYRLSGTEAEQTTSAESGAKHVIGYGEDGQIVIHDLVVNPRENTWSDPVLQSEMRWRDDASHSVAYSDLINPADKKRTITYWDEKHRPLKVILPGDYSHYGTRTTAYFPGTTQVRMLSEVGSDYNIAKYFRLNGTLDHLLKLSQAMTIVEYYDASGTNIRLEQWWERADKGEGDKKKSTYKIARIGEKDGNGKDSRLIWFFDDALGSIESYNVESGGIKYAEIYYAYDKDTKTATFSRYWIGDADHPYDKEVDYTPQDKIGEPVLPASDLTMQINPDEDPDLLLPDPHYGRD